MEKKMILEQPMEIEKKSFSIIEEHLQGVTLPDAERSIFRIWFSLKQLFLQHWKLYSKGLTLLQIPTWHFPVSINVHCKSWAEQHIVSWQMKKWQRLQSKKVLPERWFPWKKPAPCQKIVSLPLETHQLH